MSAHAPTIAPALIAAFVSLEIVHAQLKGRARDARARGDHAARWGYVGVTLMLMLFEGATVERPLFGQAEAVLRAQGAMPA